MTDTIKDNVRGFVVENFLFGDAAQAPADDESLIENDVIDSTGVLELVAFIEEAFGLTMADGDIVPANLDTLERIAAFVSARTPTATAAE